MNSLTTHILRQALESRPGSFRIFFWGLCKNAGKTTALLYTYALLKTFTARPIVILSCGYDGEATDAVTGLAKPQVVLQKGDYCITIDTFIPEGSLKVLYRGAGPTVHGLPVIAQATRAVQLAIVSAGTNTGIRKIMQNGALPGDAVWLVDGAINRRAFIELAESGDLVSISTGNTLSEDANEQQEECRYLEELFTLPADMGLPPTHPLLDTALAHDLKNTTVVLSNLSHLFLSRKEYGRFKHRGNRLIFTTPPPHILWFTFNPFDAHTNQTGRDLTTVLNEAIHTVPVINFKKESC